MAMLGPGGRAIRDAAPAIRNFGWLFALTLWVAESAVAVVARRLDSERLRAVQIALMVFGSAGVSMALVAWSIAAKGLLRRTPLAAASLLPLAFAIYSLLQLAP